MKGEESIESGRQADNRDDRRGCWRGALGDHGHAAGGFGQLGSEGGGGEEGIVVFEQGFEVGSSSMGRQIQEAGRRGALGLAAAWR